MPVGITKFHQNGLKTLTKSNALHVIKQVEEFNKKVKKQLAMASDEFFLKADYPVPEKKYYGNFAQIEDGVGALRLLMDDFFIEDRMTLLGEIVRDGQIVCSDTALNDIVLTRLESMKMLRFSLYVNDQFITRYNADGIIVATPTGSTAYSLSAGGPIVLPTSNLFVLTPICAQTLTTARSIVLPDNAYIRLIVEAKDGIRMLHQAVSFDSDNVVSVHPGDEIVIKSASDKVRLIRLDQRSFLDTLGKKLSR